MFEIEQKKVAIIDYGMGNLFSVAHACQAAGLQAQITTLPKEIEKADGLILPGVGAFANAMQALQGLKLTELIKYWIAANKPFFGICLGMQVLMEYGLEFGKHPGLGVFSGNVVRFNEPKGPCGALKVPQVGWNAIYPSKLGVEWQSTPLAGIPPAAQMYFVHSFYIVPDDTNIILTNSRYGDIEFCSSIQKGNVFACQYHPERSAWLGLKIYKNFARLLDA